MQVSKVPNKNKEYSPQKWLRLDGGKGWQVVIPEFDILPHGFPIEGKKSVSVAWLDCPCKPEVMLLEKIIIHRSFEDQKRIDESMERLSVKQ